MNPEPAPDIPVPPPLPVAAVPHASARTVRWIELILLLTVAFGSSLYRAVGVVTGHSSTATASQEWLFGLFHESSALGLCAYILHKQGRSFHQLGLTARWFDPFYGFGIMLVGGLATYGTMYALYYAGFYSPATRAAHSQVITGLLSAGIGWGMVTFVIVNAFFEELIVRAYVITDLRSLTGSTLLAVVGSAVFQGTYHLYQGWQAALGATAGFVVFSLFYIWSRRITPVIIAHMLWDLCMVAYYAVYWRYHFAA